MDYNTLLTQPATQTNAVYAALGYFAGFASFVMIAAFIALILSIVAMWKIFTKAGEKGWKAIIPIYNVYILYKISWKTSYFWFLLIAAIVVGLIGAILGQNSQLYNVLYLIILVFELILTIIQMHKLSKSFGHGGGFTLGLIFLNTIFLLILAFGSSEYNRLPETEVKTDTE